MEQASYLRLIIFVLSLTAPLLIIILNHNKRHLLGWGDVLTRIGLGAVFLAVAYSTMESYLQGIGLVFRLYVLTGALVWVNVGLFVSIRTDQKALAYERRRALERRSQELQ